MVPRSQRSIFGSFPSLLIKDLNVLLGENGHGSGVPVLACLSNLWTWIFVLVNVVPVSNFCNHVLHKEESQSGEEKSRDCDTVRGITRLASFHC